MDPSQLPDVQPRQSNNRRGYAAAAVAGLLGLAVALHLHNKSGREAEAVPTFAERPLPIPPASEAPAQPAESRLYAPEQAPEEKVMSLDQFIDTLETEAPPVHKAMTTAFKTEPKLRERWETFHREKSGKAPAAEFMRTVRPLAEFRQLMARFKGDPGFQSAFMKVMQQPELSRAMMGQLPASRMAGGPNFVGDAARRAALARMLPGAAGAPGAPGAHGATAGYAAASLGTGGHGGGPGGSSANPHETRDAGNAGTQGPEAHDVTPLNKEWKDSKTIDRSMDGKKIEVLLKTYPCLAKLGEPTVKRFINGGDVDSVGLWGACFKLHLYGQCVAAGCAQELECKAASCGGEQKACWQACLDSMGTDERNCIKEVRLQPGCQVPKDIPSKIWDVNCVPTFDAKGKQTNPPVPFQECGLGAPPAAPPSPDGPFSGKEIAVCQKNGSGEPGPEFRYYNDGTCWVEKTGRCQHKPQEPWGYECAGPTSLNLEKGCTCTKAELWKTSP